MPRSDGAEDSQWIERRIVTGLIISTEYLRTIAPTWQPKLLQSVTAQLLSTWCIDYYKKYTKAPGRDIEGIYAAKVKNGLDPDHAEAVEQILSDLSDEYERGKFNVDYLRDESHKYFTQRHLEQYVASIRNELDAGALTEAERLVNEYIPMTQELSNIVDPFDPDIVRRAFGPRAKPLLQFGRALGALWDQQFTRDAFVALMGPEKRGKSFWLLEIALRGLMANCNVAFFQAGDMSEDQQVKRICIRLAGKSDQQKYCESMFVPVIDCQNCQTGQCDSECHDKEYLTENVKPEDMTMEKYVLLMQANARYRHCPNNTCKNRRPTVWFKLHRATDPLTASESRRVIFKFRQQYKRQFKLATYPNETLTTIESNAVLDNWEKQEGFVPDIVIFDDADIMAPDADCARMDFRHQENRKWQRLRRMSQQRHCLVVTATQSDADSYDQKILKMSNFSETKTKYAHVTAMYGLNQTDSEKSIGVMRINEIVVREGDFDRMNAVHVLQRLQQGRPYLASY